MDDMKLKTSFSYSINSIIRIIIVLLCILDLHIFYLINFPTQIDDIWKELLAFVSILLTIRCRCKDGCLFKKYRFITRYTIWMLVSLIIVTIFSKLLLNYSNMTLYQMFRTWSHFFLVFLAFPLVELFEYEGYEKLFKYINYVIFAWYIIVIVQSILYSATGKVFLNEIVYSADGFINERDGMIRFSLYSLGNIMLLFNFDNLYCKRKICSYWFSILQLFLGMYAVITVQQTRAFTIVLCVTIFFIILSNSNTPMKALRNTIIIVAVGVLIYNNNVIKSLIDSFSSSGEYGISTFARTGAIEYYWKVFLSNPFCGFGIVPPIVEHGPMGIYYFSDVGIFGLLAQFGIFIIPIYGILLIRWGKIVLYVIRTGNLKKYGFIVGAYVYALLTSATLIMTDKPRIIIIPIFLALFEHVYRYIHIKKCNK